VNKFKVGDRVRCWRGRGVVEAVLGPETYYVKFDKSRGRLVGPYENTIDFEEKTDLQAKRDNKGKPESDYVFTYVGGVDAAYGRLHPYYKTLLALGSLYRAEGERLRAFADSAVYQLGEDAAKRDRSIVSMIADTNTRGAQKYDQGNYLTGANYRQYFQGAARHAEKIGEKDAEGFDHESNFVFNVLMIQHCVALSIGTDDRVKRPEVSK
jgi:hypothetical protein